MWCIPLANLVAKVQNENLTSSILQGVLISLEKSCSEEYRNCKTNSIESIHNVDNNEVNINNCEDNVES